MKTMKSFATLAVVLAMNAMSEVPARAQTSTQRPDLVALQWAQGRTSEVFYVQIQNQGTAAARESQTKVTVTCGESVVLQLPTAQIPAGGSLWIQAQMPSRCLGRQLQISAQVDAQAQIQESSELNNTRVLAQARQ